MQSSEIEQYGARWGRLAQQVEHGTCRWPGWYERWVGLVGDIRIEGMMRKLVGRGRRTTTSSVQMFILLDEGIVVQVDAIPIYYPSRLIRKWSPFWTTGSLLLLAIILGGITM